MGWGLFAFGLKPWVKGALGVLLLVAFFVIMALLQGCGGTAQAAPAPACEQLSPATATAKSVWQLPAGAATPAACDSLGGGIVQCSPGVVPCT